MVYASLLVSESSRMVGTLEQRMSVAYSTDLRVRVIEAVKAGASRREAAECFGISVSSGIRWLREWLDGGRAAAKPRGGSCSPLEEHATWLLALIEKRPDLTLEEVVAAMGKQGIEGSRTAVWRFFKRHDVSLKKRYTPASKTEPMWPARADVGSASSTCWIPPRWYFLTRPLSPPTW
jgi:transposase